MTLIVGLEAGGKVHIGGDSFAGNSLISSTCAKPKVFKVGDFIFGCTTSFRMIQLLQYSIKPPKNVGNDNEKYLCTKFIDHVRDVFKKGGFLKNNAGKDEGGTFLMGYKGKLYSIHEDFQVNRCLAGYDACGAGYHMALGALFALKGVNMTPKEKLTVALDSGSEHHPYVRPPYVFLTN